MFSNVKWFMVSPIWLINLCFDMTMKARALSVFKANYPLGFPAKLKHDTLN
jgi:hypothetical protein